MISTCHKSEYRLVYGPGSLRYMAKKIPAYIPTDNAEPGNNTKV